MVSTKVDSRVILDQTGAEALVGRGDMLYMSPQQQSHERIQGTFTPDSTLERMLQRWEKLPEFKTQRLEVTVEEPKAEPIHDTTWEEEIEALREQWREQDKARREAWDRSVLADDSDVSAESSEDVELAAADTARPRKRSRAVRFISGLIVRLCGIALAIVALYVLGEILWV